MPKRKTSILRFFTVVIAIATLGIASFVKADEPPPGVPITQPGPLVCETANFKITAQVGPNNEFPVLGPCWNDLSKQCGIYEYVVESKTGIRIDHTLITVPAYQSISSPDSPHIPTNLGDADTRTKLVGYMYHEYPVRFDPNASNYGFSLHVRGKSSPAATTVYVSSGKIKEAGLIAGPGPTFSRSGAGAFAAERCLLVAEVAAGPVYLDAPFADGCKVDQSQVWFLFNSPDCQGSALSFRDTESVPEVVYCSGLDFSCPECVRVRFSAGGQTCVQFTAQTLTGNQRFQQCIQQTGVPCDWGFSGCADAFDE